jgi:hypothetical protein
MLGSAPAWARPGEAAAGARFDGYPEEAIVDWHRSRGLLKE